MDIAAQAQDHLRQAQGALAAALRALDDPAVIPEDRPLDPGLLAQAFDHFNKAAEGLAASGQTTLEAQAQLGLAEVLLRTGARGPDAGTRLTQAERSARAGLERLDCVQEPALVLHGLLLLAEAGRHIARMMPDLREARLITTSALLDGAACLAKEQDDDVAVARVGAEACRVLSERFDGERDENLLDAIAQGEQAIELLRRAGTHSFERASLLHQLGNCCMNAAGDRAHWLSKGRGWYREGVAAVDGVRYPRLYRLLNEHAAMVDALLESNDFTLPEKEMVARYGSGIVAALKSQDAEKARRLGWGFLAWGWSLPRTPNAHIGEAHKALGKIAFVRGDWDDAQQHLYHSVGVLSAVLSEGAPWFHLLGEARDLFKQAVERSGAGASMDVWQQRAARSFVDADAACQRGARLIESDLTGALAEFEQALNAFPCHPAARFYRGAVRTRIGDLAGAIADYDFTLTLKPKSMRAFANRGSVKLALGDQDGALADLDEALKIAPDNADIQKMRAGILEQRGQREKA